MRTNDEFNKINLYICSYRRLIVADTEKKDRFCEHSNLPVYFYHLFCSLSVYTSRRGTVIRKNADVIGFCVLEKSFGTFFSANAVQTIASYTNVDSQSLFFKQGKV